MVTGKSQQEGTVVPLLCKAGSPCQDSVYIYVVLHFVDFMSCRAPDCDHIFCLHS